MAEFKSIHLNMDATSENWKGVTFNSVHQCTDDAGYVTTFLQDKGLGKTQCCGAIHIYARTIVGDGLLYLIKNIPWTIIQLTYNPSVYWSLAYQLAPMIKNINTQNKGVFTLHWHQEGPENLLIVEIHDVDKYIAWKKSK